MPPLTNAATAGVETGKLCAVPADDRHPPVRGRVNDLYTRALMPGLAHLHIGEEAVAVGIREALRADDYITSTHRGHGHCLATGAAPHLMFAELLGKEAGYCKGKGGSMHIAHPATGNLGANAIVGGGAALATARQPIECGLLPLVNPALENCSFPVVLNRWTSFAENRGLRGMMS